MLIWVPLTLFINLITIFIDILLPSTNEVDSILIKIHENLIKKRTFHEINYKITSRKANFSQIKNIKSENSCCDEI